jgi:hypothetical protein
MTSPETLAVEKFLHRFSRRSLDPIPTDGLLAAKQRIDTVIDERTRQFSLFDAPPELELVPAPSPITQHPSQASHPAAPVSQVADVLSPSQVRTFMDCSARWWYKYGLGLPDPKGSSLVRGIVVHRMAEIYLRTKFAGAAPEVDELAEIFDDVWSETSAEGSFQSGEDLDKLKAQTATLARMYLDEVAPEIEPAVIRGEPAIELRVAGEIGGVKVRGILDLLDSHGCIRDLKTAARKPSCVAPDYALQIATYAEIAPQVTGRGSTRHAGGHQDPAARHHGLSRLRCGSRLRPRDLPARAGRHARRLRHTQPRQQPMQPEALQLLGGLRGRVRRQGERSGPMRIACSIAIAALIVCLHPDAVRRIAAAIHLVRALLGDMRLH